MERILVIDNYDSFTYNLVHALNQLTNDPVDIYRNDEITPEQAGAYDRILLSPGPGIPDEAHQLKPIIEAHAGRVPMLGVCLGLQAMAEVFGGKLENTSQVYHGVATEMEVLETEDPLYHGLPSRFKVGRYHSWVVNPDGLPDCFLITGIGEQEEIMSLKHREMPLWGVQYHPESILTPHGDQLIRNWLNVSNP